MRPRFYPGWILNLWYEMTVVKRQKRKTGSSQVKFFVFRKASWKSFGISLRHWPLWYTWIGYRQVNGPPRALIIVPHKPDNHNCVKPAFWTVKKYAAASPISGRWSTAGVASTGSAISVVYVLPTEATSVFLNTIRSISYGLGINTGFTIEDLTIWFYFGIGWILMTDWHLKAV